MKVVILLFLPYLISPFSLKGKEENPQVVTQGSRYLTFKIKAVEKYNSCVEKQ